MSQDTNKVDERELVQAIIEKTGLNEAAIRLVLQHEAAYLDKAQTNAKGESDIDHDELVDYIVSRKDVKLDSIHELNVENVLDAEMEFLVSKGFAVYED